MNRNGTAKNLNPFKPGETGNPNGRPKKLPGLDQLLAEILDEAEVKAILNSIIKKAKAGDLRAAELILDRCYGKVKQPIEVDEDTRPSAFIDYTQLPEDVLKLVLNATSINGKEDKDSYSN